MEVTRHLAQPCLNDCLLTHLMTVWAFSENPLIRKNDLLSLEVRFLNSQSPPQIWIFFTIIVILGHFYGLLLFFFLHGYRYLVSKKILLIFCVSCSSHNNLHRSLDSVLRQINQHLRQIQITES